MTDRPADPDLGIDSEDLAAFAAPEPSAGFAERVLAARTGADSRAEPADEPVAGFRFAQKGRPPRGSWRWTALIAVLGCAAAAFLVLRRGAAMPDASGAVASNARETVRMGHRGVAVAEAGVAMRWHVAGHGGAAKVTLDRGAVFYRVDRGGPFSIDLPDARIDVAGTCFSVEVIPVTKPSRSTLTAAAVGALAAATIVVTVYEGRVLFADKKGGPAIELRAGDSAVRNAGQPVAVRRKAEPGSSGAAAAIALRPAPAAGATRAELLQRDQEQRAALALLEGKVATLERDLLAARKSKRSGKSADDDGRPWFDPSPESLQRFAKECRVRYDSPPIMGAKPMQLDDKAAARFGLEGKELGAVNNALDKLHKQFLASLRKLYIEATGDAGGVESLSPSAMSNEIRDKSAKGELPRIQQLIARERAGLTPAPTDWSKLSPLERYYRLFGSIGDQMEKELANQIGAARARELRVKNNGWGQQMEYAGCPDDDRKTMDVDR